MTDPFRSQSESVVECFSVRIVVVPAEHSGQRLDNFLLSKLKGVPRSLIYKLVRSGQVRVNGGRVKAERKLDGGTKSDFRRYVLFRIGPLSRHRLHFWPGWRRRLCSRTRVCWR